MGTNPFFIQPENPARFGWGFFGPYLSPMSPSTLVRQANTEKRNQRLRDAFYQRYTNVPRATRPDRDWVVAQVAEDFFLSVKTVEQLLWVPRQ